jgi:hypothetical protein
MELGVKIAPGWGRFVSQLKILERLKRTADPTARVVSADLSRLDEVRRGLGRDALDYVLNGQNATVLSSLATLCKGMELEVCLAYLRRDSPTRARRRLFVRFDPYDIQLVSRYAEVLAASCPNLPDSAAGTDAVPKVPRVFFSEAFAGVPQRQRVYPPQAEPIEGKGLTLAVAVALAEEMGGTTVDLVDLLYCVKNRWSSITGRLYRSVVDARVLAEEPDAFLAAGRRLPAVARAEFVQEIGRFGLAGAPGFVEFLLEQAGDASKSVREMARSVLTSLSAGALVGRAKTRLHDGDVNTRSGMVALLAALETEEAHRALAEHRTTEKTARIVAAIDTALAVQSHTTLESGEADSETSYQAIDGSVVEVPPLQPFREQAPPRLGNEEKSVLLDLIDRENERITRANEESARRGYQYRQPPYERKLAAQIVALLNRDPIPDRKALPRAHQFLHGPGAKWVRETLARLPRSRALRIATTVWGTGRLAFNQSASGPFADELRAWLTGPEGDLRHLERFEIEEGIETRFGWGAQSSARPTQKGDFLRYVLQADNLFLGPALDHLPTHCLWPYVAENLNVIDEAFGLRPLSAVRLSAVGAVHMLARLPKAPARHFGPLLEAATSPAKAGRAEARSMLKDAPGVAERVVALLDDSRQAVRAGAAEWLAERLEEGAIEALRRRLSKEKSDAARAAILTALERLGEDLSGYIGPEALRAEAEKGLKSARFGKLEWLPIDHLPHVRFRSGESVSSSVIRWWIFLAFKLKQPGGNALFDIHMNQLDAEDAQALSTWILESWIDYDTVKTSDSDANAHAKQHAPAHYQAMKRWVKDYTEEQAFAELKAMALASYLNSGAESKGLLALAKKAAPAVAVDRVRSYLRDHGSRTSQASALLAMLAGMGDPVALQVVIAAATRLKQKSVQKFANELVLKIAEARQWSLDELADRTIPTAGFDDDSRLELRCGAEERVYEALLGDELEIALLNPEGKRVKALPSGKDDVTKAAKKQLTASKRELKQVVAMQKARLYESLCSGRSWGREDWRRDYQAHPVMRRLIQRVVWEGLDEDGAVIGSFRPTAEGDLTNTNDDPVDPDRFARVRVAYGATMREEEALAWEQHLKDYEVAPLLTQFGRTMLSLAPQDAQAESIDDRKSWVTDAFTIRGAASKLGYERGEALDAGYFNEYVKRFQSVGVIAVIEFSGNCLPEQNVPAALISLAFEKLANGRRIHGRMKLREVPGVLLSECWNDYRAMAAKGVFDADWERKMPW